MKQRGRLGEEPKAEGKRLDLSDIAPAAPPAAPAPEALREAAASAGWGPAPARQAARPPYRRPSRRTERISARVSPETRDRFYAIAAENGWQAGETLDRIIAAFDGAGDASE